MSSLMGVCTIIIIIIIIAHGLLLYEKKNAAYSLGYIFLRPILCVFRLMRDQPINELEFYMYFITFFSLPLSLSCTHAQFTS